MDFLWYVNPAFFGVFPSIQFDSWVAIGTDTSGLQADAGMNEALVEFNSEGNLVLDDPVGGIWFRTSSAPAGEDHKVLLAQLTTGTADYVFGWLNLQVYVEGESTNVQTFEALTFETTSSCDDYVPNGNELPCGTPGFPCCSSLTACNGPLSPFNNYDPDYSATGGCALPLGQNVFLGCTDSYATNYDHVATYDDGSCIYPCEYEWELFGPEIITSASCLNPYGTEANSGSIELNNSELSDYWTFSISQLDYPNGSDTIQCLDLNNDLKIGVGDVLLYIPFFGTITEAGCDEGDFNQDGSVTTADLLPLLVAFGQSPYSLPIQFTGLSSGDYSIEFSSPLTNCVTTVPLVIEFEQAEEYFDCEGNCLFDSDGDGVCDELEILGCTDVWSCNYNIDATDEDGSCYGPEEYYDCDGNCLMDADGDGVCDEEEVAGCTDAAACNYDDDATDDDGSCEFLISDSYDCDGNCLLDTDGDGVCDQDEILGCTDAVACNYDYTATDDDGVCEYAEEYYDCHSNCLNDADGDGVCDELEIVGCTDEMACNYDDTATDDDGMCEYAEEYYDCDGNCLIDTDLDGVCDEWEVEGCTDEVACNYNMDATEDDLSCTYGDECGICDGPGAIFNCGCYEMPETDCDCFGSQLDALGVCGGDCIADVDQDGICDSEDFCIGGYDSCGICNGPGAVYECGCEDIPEGECDCQGNTNDAIGICGGDCEFDINNNGICDQFEGCDTSDSEAWMSQPLGAYSSGANLLGGDTIQLLAGEPFFENILISVPSVFTDQVTGGEFQVISWSDLMIMNLPPGVSVELSTTSLIGGTNSCELLEGNEFPTDTGTWEVEVSGDLTLDFFGVPFSLGLTSISFFIEVIENPNGIPGCLYQNASNYEYWASLDDGSCVFEGCMDELALNFSPVHTIDNGSCIYSDPNCIENSGCAEDLDGDGLIGVSDLLQLLASYGAVCEIPESVWDCGDPINYHGYDYATVQIGDQCWFAENLRTEHYINGDAIPANLSLGEWWSTASGAVAVNGETDDCYNYSPDGNSCDPDWSLNEYGRLYNWYAVDDSRELCPTEWHVPTDDEWTVLTDLLGGISVAGDQMKTTYGWYGNGNGFNWSGFAGLPGGMRSSDGFWVAGSGGAWWSATPTEDPIANDVWARDLSYQYPSIGRWTSDKRNGFSVRCLKD